MTDSGPASLATAGCNDTRRGPRSVGTSKVQLPPSRSTAELPAKMANRILSPSTTTSPVESGVIVGGGPAVASTMAAPPSAVGRGYRALVSASRSSVVEFMVLLALVLSNGSLTLLHSPWEANLTDFVAATQAQERFGLVRPFLDERATREVLSAFVAALV